MLRGQLASRAAQASGALQERMVRKETRASQGQEGRPAAPDRKEKWVKPEPEGHRASLVKEGTRVTEERMEPPEKEDTRVTKAAVENLVQWD